MRRHAATYAHRSWLRKSSRLVSSLHEGGTCCPQRVAESEVERVVSNALPKQMRLCRLICCAFGDKTDTSSSEKPTHPGARSLIVFKRSRSTFTACAQMDQ